MLKFIISILLVIVVLSSGTTSQAKIKNIWPTGLEIGFDVTRPLYYLWYEKTGGGLVGSVGVL